jgi:hypothetical protein
MKTKPKEVLKIFRQSSRESLSCVGLLIAAIIFFGVTSPAAALTISSDANQNFFIGDSATPMETITIVDDAGIITGGKKGKDIRIRIPGDFNMIWDTSITTVTFGGSAAGKMKANLKKYEDGGKTLVLDVNRNFIAGDTLTVSRAQFTDFSAISPATWSWT